MFVTGMLQKLNWLLEPWKLNETVGGFKGPLHKMFCFTGTEVMFWMLMTSALMVQWEHFR